MVFMYMNITKERAVKSCENVGGLFVMAVIQAGVTIHLLSKLSNFAHHTHAPIYHWNDYFLMLSSQPRWIQTETTFHCWRASHELWEFITFTVQTLNVQLSERLTDHQRLN